MINLFMFFSPLIPLDCGSFISRLVGFSCFLAHNSLLHALQCSQRIVVIISLFKGVLMKKKKLIKMNLMELKFTCVEKNYIFKHVVKGDHKIKLTLSCMQKRKYFGG